MLNRKRETLCIEGFKPYTQDNIKISLSPKSIRKICKVTYCGVEVPFTHFSSGNGIYIEYSAIRKALGKKILAGEKVDLYSDEFAVHFKSRFSLFASSKECDSTHKNEDEIEDQMRENLTEKVLSIIDIIAANSLETSRDDIIFRESGSKILIETWEYYIFISWTEDEYCISFANINKIIDEQIFEDADDFFELTDRLIGSCTVSIKWLHHEKITDVIKLAFKN